MDDDQDDLFRHVNPNLGYSLDLDRAMGAVRSHEEKTGTRYDVLRQDPHFGASIWNSEDCRIQWEENEKHIGERLAFDGVPFITLGSKHLGCQYGVPSAGKNNKYTEWKQEQDEHSQPRRGQCPAKVVLREVIKFPDYRIDNNNSYEKKKFSKMLRDDLTLGAARLQRRIYVELPTAEAHVHTVLVKKVNEASIAHTNVPHCLVCNAKLSASARSAVPLFSGEARTSHRQLELHSVLGSILEEDMQESCLHSSILCSRCYNLIDDIDSLEEQLINKKQVIANRYKRTMAEINKISGSKYRSSRGRGRGRPPGRSRGRGPGRPRGRPKINTPKKSPTKCIVKLEYDPERVEDLENVTFFPAIKSPPLKTIKKEDIMHGLETPENPLQKIENEEVGHIDEKVLHANVSGADMPIVEGDVTMDIQGDVLNVVEEVLEEEVKRGKMFACSECDKQFLTKAAEEMVVADEEEAARAVHAVRMAEEANTHETIEEPVQIMRDGKVVKVMSRPVHIIEADDTTRYVIHTTDRGRDENMEHFFAALQGQVVEVRSEDF
ncbi:hypothetical protein C7M84_007429 [Penaeus vannamei]|uniref:ZAD domain-containing protein n=1 Tax=Penaeus vannamei TaxID=6689 RepID=A0A423UAQ2_PENVA|nr:hypothetical protein C7M84_007429 [Penaeus vannamei]